MSQFAGGPNLTKDLDIIGGVMGTDKSSADHDYLIHYDRLFREHISERFNFLEIGIFKGASLAMWRQYFDRATIVGIDVQEYCREYATDAIIVEIGSQDDPGFLSDIVRRYPPRIIIDDGSHQAHHVMFTFEMLFPSVEPGGIYVVEDLHFHAGAMREHARGHAQVNPIDYFQALARAVILNELPAEQQWGFQAYALRTIDEVVFFGHAIAIKKKKLRIETADRTLQVTRMAEAANTADGWERAARYLAGNHDREAAMSALQRAINLAPNPRLFRQLSQHHAEMGDLGRAIETARQSVALASAHERGECLEIYGDILLRAERRDESQDAYKEAATLVQHPVVLARIEQKIHRFSNG